MAGLVDALAHLGDTRLRGRLGPLLGRAAAAGVRDIVCGGFDPLHDEAPEAALDAEPGPRPAVRLWRAAGIHPLAARPRELDEQVGAIDALCAAKKLVAIGEMGLHRAVDKRDVHRTAAAQEQSFAALLRLAQTYRLPIIVHCVHQMGLLLRLLRPLAPLNGGGVVHGFTGPAELVSELVAMGLSFSFGGQVTRPQSRRTRAAAQAVPDAHLLVESDTPDMPAYGWSGPSEPAMLPHVLAALAELRHCSAATLAAQCSENARRLYKLPPP